MTWSLLDKLAQQRESAETYSDLSSEVVVTGMTEFPSASTPPMTTELESETEAETQGDTGTDFDQDVVVVTAAPTPIQTATATPAPTPVATATLAVSPAVTRSAAPSPTPAVTPAVSEGPAAITSAPFPATAAVSPARTLTPTPTAVKTTGPAATTTKAAATPTPAAASGTSAAIPAATPTAARTAAPAATATKAAATPVPVTVSGTSTAIPTAIPAAEKTAGPAATPAVTVAATTTPVPVTAFVTPAATAAAVSLPPAASPSAAPTPAATLKPTITPKPTATPEPTPEPMLNRVVLMDSVHYSVDFAYLQTLNKDVKAWLIQDGTVINYPVLQGENNDYYLTHLFNGRINKDGSIFLDSGSSDAFGDANAYIYGHHTKTDSMFSTLVHYKEQAYYDEHPQMILLTPYGDYCIDLFAAGVFQADDETSWRVKQFTRKADFTAYIRDLEKTSLFKPKEASLPEWGDQLLVLVTCTNDQHGERYAVYGRMRQILYASTDSVTVTKMRMDQKETLSSRQEVPGRGQMMVYAQNDPLWTSMIYETRVSDRRRTFGAGGCGPTSVAMAVVNLVPRERLPDVFGYAKTSLGYTFSEYSVNQYHASKAETQYMIQTEAEYLRYFPLVMANFATGNNLWDQVSRNSSSGTSLSFLKKIAFLYKLSLTRTSDENVALEAVRNGSTAICSLGSDNPFTGGGHYVVLASVVDDYAYFLDPYRQENYDKHDADHLLTQIAPGVVRVNLKDIGKLRIGTDYVLHTTDKTASAEPPVVTGNEDD